jgi:hypothetical protein
MSDIYWKTSFLLIVWLEVTFFVLFCTLNWNKFSHSVDRQEFITGNWKVYLHFCWYSGEYKYFCHSPIISKFPLTICEMYDNFLRIVSWINSSPFFKVFFWGGALINNRLHVYDIQIFIPCASTLQRCDRQTNTSKVSYRNSVKKSLLRSYEFLT